MNEKAMRLMERRRRLIAQSAAQRSALGADIEPWRRPLALTDHGLGALRYINSHPAWIVGGVVLLTVIRPRHALKWLGRGWVAWQLLDKLRLKQDSFGTGHTSPVIPPPAER